MPLKHDFDPKWGSFDVSWCLIMSQGCIEGLIFHKARLMPSMVLCDDRAAPALWDAEQQKENAVLRLDGNTYLLILEHWQWLKTFPSTSSSPLLLQELKSIDTKVKHKR